MMQVRRTRAERRRRPQRASGVALGLLLSLGACSYVPNWASPIEWYRGVTGASKNDDTGPERNQQNLEEGSKEAFPNLASVPPMPTNALSAAEREKLRRSLAGDRANAQYLENSDQFSPTPPKVPVISAVPRAAEPAASSASATTPPTPPATVPAEPGPPAPPADVAPAPAPTAEAAPAPAETAAVPAASAPAAAPPAAETPAATTPPAAAEKPARTSEAPPAESPIATPAVGSLPAGETPREPPPAPAGVPTADAPPTPTAPAPAPVASASPRAAPAQPAGAVRPATTPPVLAAVPTAKMNLATVNFEPNTTKVTDSGTELLREAVRARQRNGGGTLHVVAFTELGPGRDLATRSIAGFNLALDRARAVGVALTQLGVPATSVSIGAGPPPADRQPGTADISLEN
jgi:outer membrane protein OmpA-like peptidoglycan-associated protein